jgi:hypothetical protein
MRVPLVGGPEVAALLLLGTFILTYSLWYEFTGGGSRRGCDQHSVVLSQSGNTIGCRDLKLKVPAIVGVPVATLSARIGATDSAG